MWWTVDDTVRVLAPSEQRFVRHATYTGRSVLVEGKLDIAVLRSAFGALLRTHPILACRIGEDADGTGHLLRPAGDAVGVWVRAGDTATVRLPDGTLDPSVQLAYLDVVIEDARARVTLYAHHAVADAGHCVALLVALWDRYTDEVSGAANDSVPQDFPRPLEWYAARHGIPRSAVSGLEAASRPLPHAPILPPDPATPAPASLARPERTILGPEATARIVELSRRHGVTVNGLVTAALLRAYAETASGPVDSVPGDSDARVAGPGDALPLRCVYPVDMRSRLTPPVAAADGTNMAGLAAFAADITSATDVVELAQRISARLSHDLAEGIVQQSVLHFPEFFGPTAIHSLAGHIAVTNTGRVPRFRTPQELTLTDYEIVYLSAHPRPSAGPSAAVTFLVYTFADRLCVGVLGGGQLAARLPDAVGRELAQLAAVSIDA
ncbi:phthiocerol/phthiodiolone dimycocerosyl transferase family protein [Nocardia sp. bgisy134]|uniref:phthiocerol/phthiodiolone dimycocerosyl transferase family protein n=1 Tax=unclassified Nocardia TaxID=2637762 RepID=UPI003D7052F4